MTTTMTSDRKRLAAFVVSQPGIARGMLVTAQRCLENALRDVSCTLGAVDMAVENTYSEPSERLTQTLGLVEDAVARMTGAARALEALRNGELPHASRCGSSLCAHAPGNPLCTANRARNTLCSCDAYSENHLPGEERCQQRDNAKRAR